MNRSLDTVAPVFGNESRVEETLRLVFYAGVIPFFILVSSVSNILTIVSLTRLLRRHKQHLAMYHNLRLLAIADQGMMIFVCPLALWFVDIRSCHPVYSFYLAHLGFPFSNACLGTSVWIAVSTIRCQYKAVERPFDVGAGHIRKLYRTAVTAFILNFILFLPMSIKYNLCVPDANSPCGSGLEVCEETQVLTSQMFRVYNWVREVFTRLLPLLSVSYYNIAILAIYRHHKVRRLKSINQYQRTRAIATGQTQQRRLFRLLTIISLLFLVSTVPGAVLNLTFDVDLHGNFAYQVFRAVANSLDVGKFSFNFFLYACVDHNIKNGLLRMP